MGRRIIVIALALLLCASSASARMGVAMMGGGVAAVAEETNLLQNGTFTGNADGWTSVNIGGSGGYSSGTFILQGNGSQPSLVQNPVYSGLTSGNTYNYSFELSDVNDPSNDNIIVETNTGADITSFIHVAGTYTGTFVANGDPGIRFRIDGTNVATTFTIDNVRIWP